jgi:hypothetical protein
MKTRFASSIRLPLLASALALAVTGCGSMSDSMHRSSDRAVQPAGYVGPTSSSGIPPVIDPFSPGYASFPASANESAGISGHSFFCVQHYNQPGCQSLDSARNDAAMNNRSAHYNRGSWSDTAPIYAGENSTGEIRNPGRY